MHLFHSLNFTGLGLYLADFIYSALWADAAALMATAPLAPALPAPRATYARCRINVHSPSCASFSPAPVADRQHTA
jgi:hypothetical protein